MARIFISYRRADSVTITGRIHDRLVNEYGDQRIFKDVDDIPLGVDFRKVLEDEVYGCDVQLVIIGADWLNITDQNNNRRLDDPNDFVRIEVAAGLKREELAVIPVLVKDAPMPSSTDLPPDVRELAYRNAAIVRDDPDFHRDMDRLIRQIQVHIKSTAEAINIAEVIATVEKTELPSVPQAAPQTAPKPATVKPQTPTSKKRDFPWTWVVVLALLVVLIAGGLLIVPGLLETTTSNPVITTENASELATVAQYTVDDFDSVGQPAWSPDNQRLALPLGTGIGLFEDSNLQKPSRILEDHNAPVNTVAFNVDGTLLVSAGDWDDPALRLWDIDSGEVIRRFEGFGSVRKVAFSADNQFIAALDDDNTLELIEIETGDLIDPPYSNHPITAFEFSPDGTLLALGLGEEAVWVWDIHGDSKLAYFQDHEDTVTDFAFSPNGELLASTSLDDSVQVWELDGYDEPVASFYEHEKPVLSVAFSPDGAHIVSTGEDYTARLWDVESGDEIAVMPHPAAVRDAAFSPDGTLLVTVSDNNRVYQWNAATGKELNYVGEHVEMPLQVAFNPNGRLLLTRSVADVIVWGIIP